MTREADRGTAGADLRHVTIVGGGIVGVSVALFLRLAGIPTTLFDRGAPGSGCSAGNAGMLGVDSCVPLGLPGSVGKIPAMLRSSDGALGIDWSMLPALLPWFFHFARATKPAAVAHQAAALNALQRHLDASYATLLEAAGARDLVRKAGKLHLCETRQAYESSNAARLIQRAHGVEMDELGPDEVRQIAPSLTRSVYRAIHFPNAGHCIDPEAMIGRMAETFRATGGIIIRDEIRDVVIGDGRVSEIVGAAGRYRVARLVLAAGIESTALAARMGVSVPMIAHRGYNLMLEAPELRLPVKSEDRKIVLTPMVGGVRVTGIAELARPDKAPTQAFARRLMDHAASVLPGARAGTQPLWMGNRPCTPDSLPVIGLAPGLSNVVLAYGHGHLGLGLGAVTGKIVSQILTGDAPLVDLTPYRPDRFNARDRTGAAA